MKWAREATRTSKGDKHESKGCPHHAHEQISLSRGMVATYKGVGQAERQSK